MVNIAEHYEKDSVCQDQCCIDDRDLIVSLKPKLAIKVLEQVFTVRGRQVLGVYEMGKMKKLVSYVMHILNNRVSN